MNEAERTNSAIGDVLADWGTIKIGTNMNYLMG